MEEKRINREDKAVNPHLCPLKTDNHPQNCVDLNHHEKDLWIFKKNKARDQKIGLTCIPLLSYLDCD